MNIVEVTVKVKDEATKALTDTEKGLKAVGNAAKGAGALVAGSGLLSMASPIGAAGVALGAFAAIAVPELSKVNAAMDKTGKAGQQAWKQLTPSEQQLGGAIKGVKAAFASVTAALAPTVNQVVTFGAKILTSLMPALTVLAKAGSQVLMAFFKPLQAFIDSVHFDTLIGSFAKFAVQVANLAGPQLVKLLDLLLTLFVKLMPSGVQILNVLLPLFVQIVGDLSPVIVVMAKVVAVILNWLTQTKLLKPVLLGLVPVILLLIGSSGIGAITIAVGLLIAGIVELSRHWKQIWGDIKNWAKDAWDFLTHGWGQLLIPGLTLIRVQVEFVRDHWHAAWKVMENAALDFVKIALIAFRDVIGAFLTLVGTIINGAARAFGWIPGLGGLLKTAARNFDNFKNGVSSNLDKMIGKVQGLQNNINGLHGKSVNVNVSGTGSGGVVITGTGTAAGQGNVRFTSGAAAGGLIYGGIAGRDSVPIMAMPGELVVPTHLVRAGAVDHLRGRLPGFAAGGLVGAENAVARFDETFSGKGLLALVKEALAAAKKAVEKSDSTANYKPGAGVEQWRGTTRQALSLQGLAQNLQDAVLYQMQTESGGNPYAVNLWDSNAKAGHPSVGLMQVIRGTFQAFAGRFRNTGPFAYGVSENPLANIYAALGYARAAYGPTLRNVRGGIGTGHGYAEGGLVKAGWYDNGGWLPTGASIAINNTGHPERILGPNERGVQLEISGGQSEFEQFLAQLIRKYVRVKGGGNVQKAFGRT